MFLPRVQNAITLHGHKIVQTANLLKTKPVHTLSDDEWFNLLKTHWDADSETLV